MTYQPHIRGTNRQFVASLKPITDPQVLARRELHKLLREWRTYRLAKLAKGDILSPGVREAVVNRVAYLRHRSQKHAQVSAVC